MSNYSCKYCSYHKFTKAIQRFLYNDDKPTSQAKWENIYSIEEETWKTIYYRNVPKFSDRHVWANSADPDTLCNSLCIFWMHYSKETPSCSTFRLITINFRVSEILGFLRYSPFQLSLVMRKRVFGSFRPGQTQTGLLSYRS